MWFDKNFNILEDISHAYERIFVLHNKIRWRLSRGVRFSKTFFRGYGKSIVHRYFAHEKILLLFLRAR